MEKIYPVHPTTLQRHFLLRHVKPLVAALVESADPEERRAGHELSAVVKAVELGTPKNKAAYEFMVRSAEDRLDLETLKYAVSRVSERKYQVVRLECRCRYGAAGYTTDPAWAGRMLPMWEAAPVSKKITKSAAQPLYIYLCLGGEVPAYLRPHLLPAAAP